MPGLEAGQRRGLIDLLPQLHQVGVTELERHQPFIANIESGNRRLDVVEFLDLARVVGFDPCDILREIEQVES